MTYTASDPLATELWDLTKWTDQGRVNNVEQYTLGFLMRKLHPAGAFLRWGVDFSSRPDAGKDKWFICAFDDKVDIRFWSTNVEDAACHLLCELIRQGIVEVEG